MTANIITWLLRLAGNAIDFLGRVLSTLLRMGASLLSTVFGVFAWPFRRIADLFGLPLLFGLGLAFLGLILILFVLFLIGHFHLKRSQNNR